MKNKTVKVVLSPEAEGVYNLLEEKSADSKTERMLFDAINQKIALIKVNIHYGNPVAKDLIPKEYKIRYGITNLFRVELPNFWRMLYTLIDGEKDIEIIIFIINIIDHKNYNKKFRYKDR